MTINRDLNPMIATSTSITLSVFFSVPTEVLEIMWANISATSSSPLVLCDIDGNEVFKSSTSTDMRVLEDQRLFANGLRVGATGITTSSVALNIGKLFVWVR